MSCKILVVDDEEQVRGMLCELLERQNYSVRSVSSGIAAVDTVAKEDFDLVILDIKLADASGLDVLKKIKENKPGAAVVMITGFGYDEELVKESRRLGAFGYISKNASIPEIISSVKTYLSKINRKE
ncbi:MAG: response regulator [Candidatus Omnitrophota bacterium]